MLTIFYRLFEIKKLKILQQEKISNLISDSLKEQARWPFKSARLEIIVPGCPVPLGLTRVSSQLY